MDREWLSKDVRIRNLKPSDYVFLHDTGPLQMAYIQDLDICMDSFLEYGDGPSVITQGPLRERKEGKVIKKKGVVIAEAELGLMMRPEDERRGQRPRNAGGLSRPEKARNWIFPRSPQPEHRPENTLRLASEDSFWTSALGDRKTRHLCCFKPRQNCELISGYFLRPSVCWEFVMQQMETNTSVKDTIVCT